MASATVQLNVRIDPKLHAQVKAKAKREGLTIAAATEAAFRTYLTSNGSGATDSAGSRTRAATKKESTL